MPIHVSYTQAQEGKENVRGWFGAASDQADDVAARARRSANRTADEVSDKVGLWWLSMDLGQLL